MVCLVVDIDCMTICLPYESLKTTCGLNITFFFNYLFHFIKYKNKIILLFYYCVKAKKSKIIIIKTLLIVRLNH